MSFMKTLRTHHRYAGLEPLGSCRPAELPAILSYNSRVRGRDEISVCWSTGWVNRTHLPAPSRRDKVVRPGRPGGSNRLTRGAAGQPGWSWAAWINHNGSPCPSPGPHYTAVACLKVNSKEKTNSYLVYCHWLIQ